MVLSKEDILRGVNDPELVKIEALSGEIPLRPLSKNEWHKIEKIEAKAYGKFEANEEAIRAAQKGKRQQKGKSKMNTKGIIDLEKQTKAEFEGKTQALYFSMNNNHQEASEWTKEEIQQLKSDAFDEIFTAVQKLSGVDIEDDDLKKELDSFPED
jgi:hypothetical protein